MGTVIEQVAVGESRWRHRHSALHLAVDTAQDCLRKAARHPHDVDLLVNAGIYRDRNLGGEPALAALIQEDIGAIPKTRMRHARNILLRRRQRRMRPAVRAADRRRLSHVKDHRLCDGRGKRRRSRPRYE